MKHFLLLSFILVVFSKEVFAANIEPGKPFASSSSTCTCKVIERSVVYALKVFKEQGGKYETLPYNLVNFNLNGVEGFGYIYRTYLILASEPGSIPSLRSIRGHSSVLGDGILGFADDVEKNLRALSLLNSRK